MLLRGGSEVLGRVFATCTVGHCNNVVPHGRRLFSSITQRLDISDSVRKALRNGKPVVALESTILAHGLPYPENINLSKELSSIFRDKGVEPATIAVKNGVYKVGLTSEEICDLSKAGQEGRASKCSTRELPLFVAKHKSSEREGHSCIHWGATTVASTIKIAHLAGISTFVTGGIGGVHKQGEITMDVSADLIELSRTPVVVVCAGVKSILDIRRTLEVLETNGVPTVSFQTDEFPAFFSPESGVGSPSRVDSAAEIADAYLEARYLEMANGMLVAVPNDNPAGSRVEAAIQSALHDANSQDIVGQAVTPFVLKRVADLTGGASLRSNLALVRRNAVIGADIAVAISSIKNERTRIDNNADYDVPKSNVVVFGGVVLDIIARPAPNHTLRIGTSNPAICQESDGGVARNIAEVLARLGSQPLLYSAVGNDSRGAAIRDRLSIHCDKASMEKTLQIVENANTATYTAILNEHNDLHTACADMNVMNFIQPPSKDSIEGAAVVILDANPPVKMLRKVALTAHQSGVAVFLEPTSVQKAKEAGRDEELLSCLTYASPNFDELLVLAGPEFYSEKYTDRNAPELATIAASLLERMNPSCAFLLITLGHEGVLLASRIDGKFSTHVFDTPSGIVVRNSTGAGDTLAGAFVHRILQGYSVDDAVQFAIAASVMTVQHSGTIPPSLSSLDADILLM